MTRSEFTYNQAKLILWIVDTKGWYAILDHAFRSDEEQKRLYDLGLSKCDGKVKISAHQYPRSKGRYAVDIYVHDGDNNIGKEELYEEAHAYWETLGGQPKISWDQAHFESK